MSLFLATHHNDIILIGINIKLHSGANNAHSDDTARLKTAVAEWLNACKQHNCDCYDPEPSPQFSTIFPPFILRSRSLVPHSFPHAPLGPPPNHLTSHLIDHLTNPQSTITCHHSAVRSIPQHHHLTPFDLPAHDGAILRTAMS